jgi:integrase
MLNLKIIKALSPREKVYRVFDGQRTGLHIEVAVSGSKIWRVKYRHENKQKLYTIGHWPRISIDDARKQAMLFQEALKDGSNPAIFKGRARFAGATFREMAEEWQQKRGIPKWSPGHAITVKRRLELYVYPHISDYPVSKITPPDVLFFIRQLEDQRKNETAARTMGIVSQVLRYAVALGVISADPTRDLKGALTIHTPKHMAALVEEKDAAGLMASIRDYEGTHSVKAALYFSAYLFLRPGEIRQAEWAEVDLSKQLWIIPATKMKGRKKHISPLPRQCLEILNDLKGRKLSDRWVFPGHNRERPLSENGVISALRRMGYSKEQMCAHGFRALAKTRLMELGIAPHLIEAQMAHTAGDKVEVAYNRALYVSQRAEMLQFWADYLDGLIHV